MLSMVNWARAENIGHTLISIYIYIYVLYHNRSSHYCFFISNGIISEIGMRGISLSMGWLICSQINYEQGFVLSLIPVKPSFCTDDLKTSKQVSK